MAKIFISPAVGKKVRDPYNQPVMPPIGPVHAADDASVYWFKRIRDGDVIVVDEAGKAVDAAQQELLPPDPEPASPVAEDPEPAAPDANDPAPAPAPGKKTKPADPPPADPAPAGANAAPTGVDPS